MSTVIYLSNQQIQIVTGVRGVKSISVKECFSVNAPEGSIINGMIMDTELFTGYLKGLWAEKRLSKTEVYLVVNSTKFVGQTMEFPKMSQGKTQEYVRREFNGIDRGEERVHGYIKLAGADKKFQRVYAESVSPDYLQEYVELFAEAGIKLNGIASGESSMIALTGAVLATQYRTFVLQIADKMTLSTILWVNGTFYYYNSVRCFHEQGTEDYAIDISRSISQIIQFMQANQIEYRPEQVILAGVEEKHMELYRTTAYQQGIRVPFQIFNRTKEIAGRAVPDIQNYLYAVSGLFVCGNTQNFLLQTLQKKRNAVKAKNSWLAGLLLIGITFAVMLSSVAVCCLFREKKRQELQVLRDYNENPVTQMQLEKYQRLWERNLFLTAQHKSVAELSRNLATYPWCSLEIMRLIEQKAQGYAQISISSFDADSGQVSLEARSEQVENIHQFISVLSEQDIFYDVNYTGYQYEESNRRWYIKVNCILSESVGRQEGGHETGNDAKR